ncbi:GTPase HflX [Dissulfurispira thermophila]|uniref:GTPase HflX n=2 Tax=root TaxID=1 RepID=A0A7G1H2E3_9BACT|nr:GTPase HflX [Dissulfurispira thermophila]BCB96362.1 GTPase HflX [Dissulfurispira thermophila]
MIVGDAKGVFIPDLNDYPIGRKALRGLRFIHTHLSDEPLNREDITDLSLLRFDMIAAISIRDGLPYNIYVAYLMPYGSDKKYEILTSDFYRFELDYDNFIYNLEEEMDRHRFIDQRDLRERAILVSASTRPKYELEESMDELKELAVSSDVIVIDEVIQRLKEINPRYILGEGKLKEIVINAMNKGATLLIFDQDLSPSQIRAIAETTELKVIDRSQLILDIFARRAHSRDGKVQVELAQLRYMLPRLTGKGTAMSRLMGGIGGRGPGEMKLEIDRRRIRDRITRLEKELEILSEARRQRKQRRVETGIPIVSIIGYTNAGKSTLLNALTNSATFVEDRMFATLDTASRRLRFPREREIIITDTVGFIKDLPKDLMTAFKATLEELEDADLLLHLVDISNPRFEQQINSVENILEELNIKDKPKLLVFNKIDKVSKDVVENIALRYNAVAISAVRPESLGPLLKAIEHRIWETQKAEDRSPEDREQKADFYLVDR